MIIYLLVILFLVFVIYKERQALGCPKFPTGEDCDNANGKAVKGTAPSLSDTNDQIYAKISTASRFMDRWVVWRLSILIGAASILFFYFFAYQRFPSELELVLGIFVISSTVYFALNFYRFHLVAHIEKNINDGLAILASRQ